MTDELTYWQMALSFWEKGTFLFHGKPYDIPSILYPILLSPLFAIPDLTLVFDLARLVNAFLLSSVLFPTYGLAREFADSSKALFPAVLAGLVPGAVYSSLILAENLYYPLFCLSFWLAYRTLERANWRDAALTAFAFFVTYFTKPHLLFLVVAYGAALVVNMLQRLRRKALERGVGFGLLPRLSPFVGLGAAVALRVALRGGFHPGESWKGILGGDAYAVVFASTGGVPPIRIAGVAIGLLLTLSLGVGFVPAGNFFGAVARFRSLPYRLRTYLVLLCAVSVVYLAAVIRISLFDPEPRMHERYLFALAPMLLVLLSLGGRSERGILLAATAALWLGSTIWLSTRYRHVLNWNVPSDSPSLTAFFFVSRRSTGVVPLIISAVVVGAFALGSILRRRIWPAFAFLGLLLVLLNASWYAHVYGIERELRFFKEFALNVGHRVRTGDTVAVITDGLDPRVVWALEFWLRNPVALLTVSEQKSEWWIDASGSYADLLRWSRPSLLVAAATTEKQFPGRLRLLGRAPGLPTPAVLYADGPPP